MVELLGVLVVVEQINDILLVVKPQSQTHFVSNSEEQVRSYSCWDQFGNQHQEIQVADLGCANED